MDAEKATNSRKTQKKAGRSAQKSSGKEEGESPTYTITMLKHTSKKIAIPIKINLFLNKWFKIPLSNKVLCKSVEPHLEAKNYEHTKVSKTN